MKQNELIEIAQKATGSTKPADLCRATGIRSARLADLTSVRRPASNDEARRLAEVAQLNPFEVIAELEIERAQDDATRTAWGKALASIRGKAVVLVLAVMFALSATVSSLQTSAPWCFLRRRRLTIIFIM
jgi:hypothetical protein